VRLQVNQEIWVQGVGEHSAPAVTSTVAYVSTESVTLRFPGLAAVPQGFVADSDVLLRMTDQNGIHTAVARVRRTVASPVAMITLASPLRFATKQDRKFFRVAAKLPVLCAITDSWDKKAVGKADEAASTQDISAGGVCLLTKLPLCVGDQLALELKLRTPKPTETLLQVGGRVTRVAVLEGQARRRIVAGVEFSQGKREQDALVLIMFELQRLRMR
jgi:c-di-GMP-binding flagellar brake protein YcgR